jgi:hypothetical protein
VIFRKRTLEVIYTNPVSVPEIRLRKREHVVLPPLSTFPLCTAENGTRVGVAVIAEETKDARASGAATDSKISCKVLAKP